MKKICLVGETRAGHGPPMAGRLVKRQLAAALAGAVWLCSPATQAVILQEVCAFGGDWRDELVQGLDGHFYGTTQRGGSTDKGTIFRVTTNGVLTPLVSFTGTNGEFPWAGLMRARDGNFYRTTTYGGANGLGTVFRVTPGGALTTLAQFNGADGAFPTAVLLEGQDGLFYGTTIRGGVEDPGTVFRLSTNGDLTALASFPAMVLNSYTSPLVQDDDGNLYGITSAGGANEAGQVFMVTTNGAFTTLASFTGIGTMGQAPCAGLVHCRDGNLYGTTYWGGGSGPFAGRGTVFKITRSGALSTVKSFTGSNGAYPVARLLEMAQPFPGEATIKALSSGSAPRER